MLGQRRLERVLDEQALSVELPVGQADDQFDKEGLLVEEALQGALAEHVAELVAAVPERVAA